MSAAKRRGGRTRSPEPSGRGRAPSEPRAGQLGAGAYALLFALFSGAALMVYEPALQGPFLSDDHHYVSKNLFVQELSVENVAEILDPFGAATIGIANYSPVQLLIHMLAWKAFGASVSGHHLGNLGFHILASLLLVPLLLRVGVPALAAVFGSAFFLLHPANVEAVAWVSQLKSSSALALSLIALLAFPRRPGVATVFFALALLAKPTAAYALPVVALLAWTGSEAVRWRWLVGWAALLVAFAVPEFVVHQRSGAVDPILFETPLILLRTMMAFAMRYLVMATTSFGVSAFHEPEPSFGLLEPWWLGSLVTLSLLGWRVVVVARRRDPELAFWVWVLVSFGPVSQIFPFLYPLADRYLYFILPGLIGAALLAGREALGSVLDRLAAGRGRSRPALHGLVLRGCALVGALVLIPLAIHSHARAALWRSATRLNLDAASNYPSGTAANLLNAQRAAQAGDAEEAVRALRRAYARGFNLIEKLMRDPTLAPIRSHPDFKALIAEIAQGLIDSIGRRDRATQNELRMLAYAHALRGEYDQADTALRRALEIGGPLDAQLRVDLQGALYRDESRR